MVKLPRFELGAKIDSIFIASHKTKPDKLSYLNKASDAFDILKFMLQIMWEINLLDSKKYIALSKHLEEIARRLGGGQKKTKPPERVFLTKRISRRPGYPDSTCSDSSPNWHPRSSRRCRRSSSRSRPRLSYGIPSMPLRFEYSYRCIGFGTLRNIFLIPLVLRTKYLRFKGSFIQTHDARLDSGRRKP